MTGEQVVDIRDFDIASPTVLMLRIYPDVVVKLYVEAEEVDGRGATDVMWLLAFAAGYVLGARAEQGGVRRRRARRSGRSATPRRSATWSSSCAATPDTRCAASPTWSSSRRGAGATGATVTVVLGADLVERVRRDRPADGLISAIRSSRAR